MIDLHELRKTLISKELKRDTVILCFCVFALLFFWCTVIMIPAEFRRKFMAVAVIFTIPLTLILYLCISWYIRLKIGSLAVGIMDEVLLEDGSQPYIHGMFTFTDVNGSVQTIDVVLESYGDRDDDCEEELQLMLESDRGKYEHRSYPVIYDPAKPQKGRVILSEPIG